MKESKPIAFRGAFLHCLGDPASASADDAIEYYADGILCLSDGVITGLGSADEVLLTLPAATKLMDYRDRLIVPGFVDTHVHYSQTDIIGSYGAQLLEWLNTYTFPAEARFEEAAYAEEVSEFFVSELLRNGTTTALVLATVHPGSVDAIFTAAQRHNLRLLAGKVLMDRHAPDYLCDTPERGYQESKALIERWHGQGRLGYAITPRFAPTSTDAQLQSAGELAGEYPDVHIHTHVAENHDEVAWVAKLFPWARSYLDVYDHYHLLRERAVFAHCLHLDADDRTRMADAGAAMAFCPTSNLFLGSGLFDLDAAREQGIRVGLATDIGGGTSLNMLRTIAEAYKVLQLNGQQLSAYQALYLATLGGAKALYLDDKIGNFAVGKEADFVVLDLESTPLITRRMKAAQSIEEQLFALMILGDDRAIKATYVMGELVHRNADQ